MQKFLSRLFRTLMKSWSWVLLIVLVIAIKWLALYPEVVEKYYTYGLYPILSKFQRLLLGWIPFSAGDLFYGFLVLLIIFRVIRFFRVLFTRKLNRRYLLAALQQSIFLVLFVYVFFNGLWGLNYNRVGIARQLDLKVQLYSMADLDTLANTLQTELNRHAAIVARRDNRSGTKRKLFENAKEAYMDAATQYAFMQYDWRSVKPSIFSYAGNYLGFQGYYNPFSGEAQVNTTVPQFIQPFVTTHEMAHQLGYAKENEANFVGFLACLHSSSADVRYSMYFDMYNYAAGEIYRRDSAHAREVSSTLHPKVVSDIRLMKEFLRKHRNPVENFVMWGYGNYLKANNQPAGKMTYNQVVGWLIAYYKKYGTDALVARGSADE